MRSAERQSESHLHQQVKFAAIPILLSVLLIACNRSTSPPPAPASPSSARSFDGDSANLQATAIVATLDTPIPSGKNAIWCGSFVAAWKTLADRYGNGTIDLEGDMAKRLNTAVDIRPQVFTNSLYTVAGKVGEAVINQIRNDLKQRFPDKPAPIFPMLPPNALVSYAYLETAAPFTVPYFQNDQSLKFTDAEGKTSGINSFGIRKKDDYAYYDLRKQVRVLFRKGGLEEIAETGDASRTNFEFAVDLCVSSPSVQTVIARIDREPTLAAAMARVEKEIEGMKAKTKSNPSMSDYYERIGPNDTLLIPDLFWRISHRFSELEGKPVKIGNMKGAPLAVAQQDIQFRLDRNGVELKSEAKVVVLPIPTHFEVGRPFLIYMKKRGATQPFFAMWVDNAELLQKWTGKSSAN